MTCAYAKVNLVEPTSSNNVTIETSKDKEPESNDKLCLREALRILLMLLAYDYVQAWDDVPLS